MDDKLLVVKGICLLYLESLTERKLSDSVDLVRTVIEEIKSPEVNIGFNTDKEIVNALKTTALYLCDANDPNAFDKLGLLQRLKLNCGQDDKLFKSLEQIIDKDMKESQIKKYIDTTTMAIRNHFMEKQLGEQLKNASMKFNFQRNTIKDVNNFIEDHIKTVERFYIKTTKKTEENSEIDLSDESSLQRMFDEVVQTNDGSKIYKSGQEEINEMLQGGYRPGEFWLSPASLEHNYKTGFSLSEFVSIPLLNRPFTTDPTKKPLALRISFEDPLVKNIQFMYMYLKYSETRERVDMRNVTAEYMKQYVIDRMKINGWHIKLKYVRPGAWSYKSLFNYVDELRNEGYSIETIDLDYMFKMSKDGCSRDKTGDDILDLADRIHGFANDEQILIRTPHQLSTDANTYRRQAASEGDFVKDITGKGFFEGSKGLGRIMDGIIYGHIVKHFDKRCYYTMQLGKHRFPIAVDESKKFVMYQMPQHGMPIPHPHENERLGMDRFPASKPISNSDFFDF